METKLRGQTVTREAVLEAIIEFDRRYPDTNSYENWLEKKSYKHALDYKGKLYPPKFIISQASGLDTSEFSGGDNETNRAFRQLGFTIIDKP